MRAIERIHRIISGKTTIRVWAKSEDLRDVDEHQLQLDEIWRVITVIKALPQADQRAVPLAELIAELPFCNAVEVNTSEGAGILIYPNWP